MCSSGAPTGKIDYIESLDIVSRERYSSKLRLINDVDPYKLASKEWTCETDKFPDIAYPDIVNYLVHSQSAYTLQDLKAYKSLESYNQFVCGWVKDVRHKEINNRSVITARVQHSQRMNATPLKPWIIAEKDGTVLAGHCDCMAGLGEVCSHVGAVLFYVDALVKLRNSKTVTQEPAYWMLPSGIQKVEYSMVRDINFKSAKSMRKDLNDNIEGRPTPYRRQVSSQKMPSVSAPSESEIAQFYRKLHNSKGSPVILSLTPDYAPCYVPSCLGDSFPMILTELYDENMTSKPIEELLDHCEDIFKQVTVSPEQSQSVELDTKAQTRSKAWFNFRLGRITASRMKAVCSTSLVKPSASLIKGICYPHTQTFSTEATKWGCQHESTALAQYVSTMSAQHDDFKCEPSGLIISSTLPYIGASPDSVVSCKCCGDGVVEIKCPYCVRTKSLADSLDGRSCLELVDGQLQLKRNHAYYYQVQTQLHISGREYCDFIVWTEKDFHTERIEPDPSLWTDIVCKAELFFKRAILPELVAKYYSKPMPAVLQTSACANIESNTSTSTTCTHSDSQIICICQQPYDEENGDRVIGCDNQNCKYQWLHFKCINLKRVPKGAWYCFECRKLPQFAKKKPVVRPDKPKKDD